MPSSRDVPLSDATLSWAVAGRDKWWVKVGPNVVPLSSPPAAPGGTQPLHPLLQYQRSSRACWIPYLAVKPRLMPIFLTALCEIPRAAVTKHHKLGDFQQQFRGPEAQTLVPAGLCSLCGGCYPWHPLACSRYHSISASVITQLSLCVFYEDSSHWI